MAEGGKILCGFELPLELVCMRPAPCPIPTHHQADSAEMLRLAREAAARGKAPAPELSLELMDRADAAADAIELETDPTGWQPADQPAGDWGGVAEWGEINTAVWSGSINDPGRVEECLAIALGALGSIAGRGPMDPDAVHALRRIRQRAELGGPLPAYPRGPHV